MKKHHLLFIFSLLLFGNPFAQTLTPTDKLAALEGTVTNFKGKPLGKEIILLVNDKTGATLKVTTDAKGKFAILVPVDATYSLKYKTFTSDASYSKMQVPADKEATYEVQIKIDPPREYVLENVYFDTGKSSLKPASGKALSNLAELLKVKNTMVVEIQGHTDDSGKPEDNLSLSQARAEAVKKYLVLKGVEESRIVAKGYGSSMPVADNATEEGKAKNRRTNLKVIKE